MPGICKYCVGCLRLEDENFKSRYRCKDFEANQVNQEELIKNELEKNQEEKMNREYRKELQELKTKPTEQINGIYIIPDKPYNRILGQKWL